MFVEGFCRDLVLEYLPRLGHRQQKGFIACYQMLALSCLTHLDSSKSSSCDRHCFPCRVIADFTTGLGHAAAI